ncbi:ATP-binding protein [Ohtaekwangia kribbensis]|uniref:ATP-binding protein n=1 Tax=Ohtaekwangia kribbensis TaxID=688913 RepID=A0ABW3K411_9BACT
MSKLNISGIVENIQSRSSVYTPVIEAIVNAIQAIEDKTITDGKIEIVLHRKGQLELSDSIPDVKTIEIIDNGIGFNTKNRDSFDTFYSELKKEIGGKGFGRFLYPKYFQNTFVESVFRSEEDKLKKRAFKFGSVDEIIVDETIGEAPDSNNYTKITLSDLRENHRFEKQIETISKRILERILIYFINDEFACPVISVKEADGSNVIVLNEYLKSKKEIQLFKDVDFEVKGTNSSVHNFKAKIFKIYYPANQTSKVSLVGHNREVTDSYLHRFIPEFEDEFFDSGSDPGSKKNFIIKTYVLGKYLDSNVSLERETFNFPKENRDAFFPLSQADIENRAAEVTKDAFNEDVKVRSERKVQKVREYVNSNAPWHKPYLKDLDLSKMPYNLPDNEIELQLQNAKFKKEQSTVADLKRLMNASDAEFSSNIGEAISKISEIGKSDLAHYVFNRKIVLETFTELLKRREDGKGELEEQIHNLIFPMRTDSETTAYRDHNLWLLDERLVFSEYVASDRKISTKRKKKGSTDNDKALGEPDLVVFDKKRSFRSGENEFSNPLTIFEFKRPKRDNYKADEDPIKQIGEYLDEIRAGKYDMPEGLEKIKVNDYTPVYAFVVCDINDKIKAFAKQHSLTPSPDQEGYFSFHVGYKMYVELISFKKLLNDANLRNKIFFKKLQLE